jgi:hypothetical protein
VRRAALVATAGALIALLSVVVGRADATTPAPAPRTATIDVAVDSHLGDTSAVIDCGAFGVQHTVNGDGTLILANVYANAKVRCTITLRG